MSRTPPVVFAVQDGFTVPAEDSRKFLRITFAGVTLNRLTFLPVSATRQNSDQTVKPPASIALATRARRSSVSLTVLLIGNSDARDF